MPQEPVQFCAFTVLQVIKDLLSFQVGRSFFRQDGTRISFVDSDDSLSSVQDYFARLANIPSHYAPSDTRGDLDRKKFLCNLFKTTTEQCRERELKLTGSGTPGLGWPADMSNWIRKITKINNFHPSQPGQQSNFHNHKKECKSELLSTSSD